MQPRFSIFSVIYRREMGHALNANDINSEAEIIEKQLRKESHLPEQENLLRRLKVLAAMGSQSAQEAHMRLEYLFNHSKLATLIVENLKEITNATRNCRLLNYLYLLLSKIKDIFIASDIKCAIELLQLSATQSGPHATEAAFMLAYLYSDQYQEQVVGSIRGSRSSHNFYTLSDLLMRCLRGNNDSRCWLAFAELGEPSAIERILASYDDVVRVEPNLKPKAVYSEMLKHIENHNKGLFNYYINLAIDNMAKYGWINPTSIDELSIFSYLLRLQMRANFGNNRSLLELYAPTYAKVKERFIQFANEGYLYANFYLGIVAQYSLPCFYEDDKEESEFWYERIMNLNVTPCETVFWVGRQLIERNRLAICEDKLISMYQNLFDRGCYISGVHLGFAYYRQKNHTKALYTLSRCLSQNPHESINLIHQLMKDNANQTRDILQLDCIISIYVLCIQNGCKESFSPIISIVEANTRDMGLKRRWLIENRNPDKFDNEALLKDTHDAMQRANNMSLRGARFATWQSSP